MKAESQNENDRQLQGLLQEWKLDTSLPPRFEEQVWRRTASEETPAINPLLALKSWIGQLVAKPAFAFSYATVLLLIGLSAGLWQAQEKSHRTANELSVRYVQMLDPYQMPRH